MAQMPIDQEYDRHIAGIQENEDGSADVDLPDDDAEIEELEDGSAIVHMGGDDEGSEGDSEFYENLAESIDLWQMDTIGRKYLDLIEKDQQAREKRDKQYEEGIRRTGLGDDAPGGANFMGASKVVHPAMAEACVDFASSAIKEMFPPDGPVRTKVLGDATDDKTEIAERKRDYMNWQLTEQIQEFRDEQEQLLTQLPLGGSQFMKMWYDEVMRRPRAEFVPIDNILLPFSSVSFYMSQRVTEMQDITDEEFKKRIASGLYRDISYVRATEEPEETKPEKASNKVEGKEFQDNEDGVRRVFHIYTNLELEDDPITKGELAPYVLMIDELDSEVLGIYRNWEEGDETLTKLDWIIEFKFIPWRGAYAIGLPHLIGGLSAALTGALRALLDTAHINNSATMLKLKGAKISGQSDEIEVTQVVEIEGAPGVDDIRKIAMPVPFNPPSQVLFELLGWLDTASKGVITTSEEKIADINANAPVGTTLAMIEQGAKVMSAIHARLHDSQRRVLQVLGRINRWHLDDQRRGELVEDLPIKASDFKRNSDVVPVSDPHIFSESQRMAQNQAVLALMDKYPQAFDQKAVLSRVMKQMKIPALNELMPNVAKPKEMDASHENAAMMLAHPAAAFPRQDHLAHIQAHLTFALDPNLGSNALIAPTFIPQCLEHIKQHIMLWYIQQMSTYATHGTGINLQDYDNSNIVGEIDKAVALASEHVNIDSGKVFEKVTPALQQLGQLMQQFAPKPQMDGADIALLQASMAETQRKTADDQASNQFDTAKLQAELAEKEKQRQTDVAMNAENNLTTERIKTAELTVDEVKLRQEQERTATELNREAQKHLGE